MRQSDPTTALVARESGDDVVIYDPDEEDAWIRAERVERLRWCR